MNSEEIWCGTVAKLYFTVNSINTMVNFFFYMDTAYMNVYTNVGLMSTVKTVGWGSIINYPLVNITYIYIYIYIQFNLFVISFTYSL